VVDLYLKCGEHHLPRAGGMEDQDAWTMDAFTVLRSADATIERAKFKAAEVLG